MKTLAGSGKGTRRINEEYLSTLPISLLATHKERSTFYHEAGHAVLAVHLGHRCDCIRLGRRSAGNGLTEVAAAATSPWLTRTPDRHVTAQISAAGHIAQVRAGDEFWQSLEGAIGDITDLEALVDNVSPLRGICKPQLAAMLFGAGQVSAFQAFEEHPSLWNAVEDLADVIRGHWDRDLPFVEAYAIYGALTPHIIVDPWLVEPVDGDPCAD